MTTSAISTAGLTKHYPGVQALTDLSLEVPAGSVYGFLGPNGAGKSTTLKLLAGLASPTSGTASVAGVPLEAGAAYRREVGYLAQDPRFYDWMTGRETLRFVASTSVDPSARHEAWIGSVLETVGLDKAAADRRTKTYSGGMRQRLGIAQALVTKPTVLLLDEPVSALDPLGRREVLDLMASLKGEITIFYSTHILDDVQRVADNVAILDGGRLVRAAPTSELIASFSNDRLRVVVGGADDATGVELARLPRVASVEPAERDGDLRTYLLRIAPEDALAVQRDVTRFAVEHDLTLAENGLVRLALEDVFLSLIDTKERAA
ncbi:MAG TPA: ABC transporter ATP-binding protein [Candidatus Limnocylindrales bacterium]|nr:ABC transporter ATP-binding protein [Candidatus Limnocylindrales bacterium]